MRTFLFAAALALVPASAFAGTATLTLTTDGGSPCTPATASKTQVVHPRPTANTCNPVGDYCYSNAGSIDVKASGGTAPYNVTWTPAHGMTQPAVIAASGGTITVTGLHANTPYTFTVTDANLCTAQ